MEIAESVPTGRVRQKRARVVFKRQATKIDFFIISRLRCSDKLSWLMGYVEVFKIYTFSCLKINIYIRYICIVFLNTYKRIHSISDYQVKKSNHNYID